VGSFLRKLAEHAIPLGVVVLLMGGSAVAGGLITGSQIQNGSVTGRDIKDHSLTLKDIKGSAGPQGDVGPVGPAGQPGSSTLGGVEQVTKSTETTTDRPKELIVDCPRGPVLSGGFVVYPPEFPTEQGKLRVLRSYALDADSWLVRATSDDGLLKWQLTVVAVCSA
jgi:hypothetical protein